MSEEDVFMSEAMSSHSDMPLEDINRTPTFNNPSPNPVPSDDNNDDETGFDSSSSIQEIESDTDFIEPPGNPELWLSRPEKSDRYLALKLPPMHTLEDIFEDIASKAMSLGFADVLKHLNGRPLRIATVCSGTESPILAMEMLQKGKLFYHCSSFLLTWSSSMRFFAIPLHGVSRSIIDENDTYTFPLSLLGLPCFSNVVMNSAFRMLTLLLVFSSG